MKKYSSILMVLVLVFSFGSVAALADSGGNGGGVSVRGGGNGNGSPQQDSPRSQVMGMSGLIGLELGEQQRDQIRLLMQEHQALIEAERERTREQARLLRGAMVDVMEAEIYDEAAAIDILEEQAELNIERKLIRQRLQHRILHEVLTEGQRNQLQNMWQNQAAFSDAPGQGPGPGEGLGDCPYM